MVPHPVATPGYLDHRNPAESEKVGTIRNEYVIEI
jgi:hypothetical protein